MDNHSEDDNNENVGINLAKNVSNNVAKNVGNNVAKLKQVTDEALSPLERRIHLNRPQLEREEGVHNLRYLQDKVRRSLTASGNMIRSIRYWDVKMFPKKKHMVNGRLTPAVRGTGKLFGVHYLRRLTLEIHTPPPPAGAKKKGSQKKPALQSIAESEQVSCGDQRGDLSRQSALELERSDFDSDQIIDRTLGNLDGTCLRFHKRIDKSDRSIGNINDDDDTVTEDHQPVSELGFTSCAHEILEGWKGTTQYNLGEVAVLKVFGRTVELQLGFGSEMLVREIEFESEEHVAFFTSSMDKMNQLRIGKRDRQLQSYHQEMSVRNVQKNKQKSKKLLNDEEEDEPDEVRLLVEIVSAIGALNRNKSSHNLIGFALTQILSLSLSSLWQRR